MQIFSMNSSEGRSNKNPDALTSSSVSTSAPLLFKSSISPSQLHPPPVFGPLSSDASDRVFPIRSIVNVEPPPYSQSPGARSSASFHGSSVSRQNSVVGTPVGEEFYFGLSRSGSSADIWRGSTEMSPPSTTWTDSANEQVGSEEATANPEEAETSAFITARHRHIMSEEGHMIITGIAGAEKIQRCEDEPIHIPGAVQGFGCLVALREQDEEFLEIRVVSEVYHFASTVLPQGWKFLTRIYRIQRTL